MLLRNEMKIQDDFSVLTRNAAGSISGVACSVACSVAWVFGLQCCVRRLPCSLFCLVLSCVQVKGEAHWGNYEKNRR